MSQLCAFEIMAECGDDCIAKSKLLCPSQAGVPIGNSEILGLMWNNLGAGWCGYEQKAITWCILSPKDCLLWTIGWN